MRRRFSILPEGWSAHGYGSGRGKDGRAQRLVGIPVTNQPAQHHTDCCDDGDLPSSLDGCRQPGGKTASRFTAERGLVRLLVYELNLMGRSFAGIRTHVLSFCATQTFIYGSRISPRLFWLEQTSLHVSFHILYPV